jgi:RNA polymerase sigma factor (sigma-70 family)
VAIDRIPSTARHLPARLALGPALRLQSDRRLVGLVRSGDERAFEEIVRRYRRPLDRFAASIVGAAADDVTQDSFRKALEALRQAEDDVELRPWLFRIVRNTALNDLRDRPPAAAELAEDLVAGGRSAAVEAEQRAELQDLTAKLQALPENQRAALVMRELEGMSHEEIAAALGISDGAARQAIARARAAIRSGLGALVPLPLLRAPAGGIEGFGGSGAGGGAIAAGAGGIGAGALKVGLATVVVAGTIGAGVAIEHRGGGHTAVERQSIVAAPNARSGGTARSSLDPSPAPTPWGAGGDRSPATGHGGGASSPPRQDGHRLGHAGAAASQGSGTVPVAQQTTVAAPEAGSRSHAGGGPGPSQHDEGRDGSGGGGHQTTGGDGHQGTSDDGGDHTGSRGGGGGGRGSFGSGAPEASGGSASAPSKDDGGSDRSGENGTVSTAVQSPEPSDDGSPSGDGGPGTPGGDGSSGGESGATPEASLSPLNESLPEGGSEPSP